MELDLQPVCDAMKGDGITTIDANSLCNYLERTHPGWQAWLGDYPFGRVASWLDVHPQGQEKGVA
jgi:hypothetical protein